METTNEAHEALRKEYEDWAEPRRSGEVVTVFRIGPLAGCVWGSTRESFRRA